MMETDRSTTLLARSPRCAQTSTASACHPQQFNAPGHYASDRWRKPHFRVITQFPLSVGHGYTDVSQQMAGGMKGS